MDLLTRLTAIRCRRRIQPKLDGRNDKLDGIGQRRRPGGGEPLQRRAVSGPNDRVSGAALRWHRLWDEL